MAKAKKETETAKKSSAAPAAKKESAPAPKKAAAHEKHAAAPAKKPAVAAQSGKQTAAKKALKSAVTGAPGVPIINTSLAAQNAARLVANRDVIEESKEGNQTESSSFRQLKESLNKPHSQAPAAFLQNTAPHKKLNLPFGGLNQVGKGQTFGADVNRAGVPRRTGG
jgi:hypothetical protein